MTNDFQQELLSKIKEGLKPSDLKTGNSPTKPNNPPENNPNKPKQRDNNTSNAERERKNKFSLKLTI